MKEADINLSSLAKYFSDEAEAYKLIESIRWPNGPVCPHCGVVNRAYHLKNQRTRSGRVSPRSLWKCAECRKQFTVTVGTIFEDSHIPLSKWLQGAFLMSASKNGVAALELQRTLDLSYKAAWFMAHRLRHAMVREPAASFLKGIVESDETYIGGRIKGRGKGPQLDNKTAVVTLVERNGEARSMAVDRVNRDNLATVLQAHVDPSATLMTDQNTVYALPGREFASHQTVDHQRDEYVRGPVHVNTAEGYFSQLKRSIDGTHHHVSRRHLPRYLAEFDLRYNLRKVKDGERMAHMIRQTTGRRLTYREPTGKPKAV